MTTFPNAPRIVKGGLVLLDPRSARVLRIISLQYNPDSLSRSFQLQTTSSGGEGGNRSEPMRFKGPAVETIKLDAEIDGTDQLEFPGQHQVTVQHGIQPQLALMEALAHPSSSQLRAVDRLAGSGALEIAPMEAPLLVFVWGKSRIVPVRLSDFSITEEAFDPSLNPLRAKVSLGMRVLSVDDLGFHHPGSGLFLGYLQTKERMATLSRSSSFATLGLGGLG